MSAASRTGRPPEPTASPDSSSTRRTFLKGVGLAGAAGLAAPLLTRTSARAATTHPIVLGSLAGDWTSATYPYPKGGYAPDWLFKVPGAFGCRSYRDVAFSTGPGSSTDPGCPTTFPGEPGSKPVASIRPDPTVLLNPNHKDNPGMVQALKNLILDGMGKATAAPGHPAYFAGTPQLTVWHEAGFFYGTKWSNYGVNRGGSALINGTTLDSAYIMRRMHAEMQNLCNQVANDPNNQGLTHVEYGCIIYGDIDKMASATDTKQNYVPESGTPLDWYGIDVYYEPDPPDPVFGPLNTHDGYGTLDGSDDVNGYLDDFYDMVQLRSPGARINITECNASDNSARPQFLENLASWLHTNLGYRMLTFFPTDQKGTHNQTWQYVANAPTGTDFTIDALNTIQNNYGGG